MAIVSHALRTVSAIVVAVGGLTAIVLLGGTSSRSGTGRSAPPLPTGVLVAPRVTLASLRGKPAAINFWASWCSPCRKEAPDLARAARDLRGRARVVGVDWNDAPDAARSYLDQNHLTDPSLVDSQGLAGDRYGLTGLPTTFILDSEGRIAKVLRGPQTADALLRALRSEGDA